MGGGGEIRKNLDFGTGPPPARAPRVSPYGVLGRRRLSLLVCAVGRRSLGLGRSQGDGAGSGASSPHTRGPLETSADGTEEHDDWERKKGVEGEKKRKETPGVGIRGVSRGGTRCSPEGLSLPG